MKNTETIKKVLKYIKQYKLHLSLSILLSLITVALTLYVPILIGNAIDNIIGEGKVNFEILTSILIKIVIVIIATSIGQWLMNIINNKITFGVVGKLRTEAFEKIEKLPLSYIDNHPSGDIVSRVIADADQFADGLLMGFTQFFTGLMTIIGTIFFMIKINWIIALVVIILTPISLFVAKFIASRTYKMFKEQSEIRGEQTALIDENINNLKIIKAFSREEKSLEEFDEINNKLYNSSLKAVFYSSITNPSTRFVNNIIYAIITLIGALFTCNSYITIGQLSSFLSYSTQYTKPFNEISGVITELQNAITCAQRLLDLIDEPIEIEDNGSIILNNPEGNIDLKDVCFSYNPNSKFIENLNISVKPGQRVAIVGTTGCGKTTLINLLMRFYETTNGEVIIDNKNIKDITRKSLRNSYGMVLQDTWLKTGTIRDNIIVGKPDATEEEIIEAAKASHCYSFIRRLPQGFDTFIGEDEGGLSQGQKQLLCIARIMLRFPPMLILDEATSSIDTRTEIDIQNAFQKLMNGKTSFIVAHRLSTIKNADIILVMDKGKIIQQGTHDELMKIDGFYKNLYNSQFKI